MNNLKDVVEKLKEQKKMLETIIANFPHTEKQKKAVEEAKNHLEKINSLLESFGENNV